MVFGETFCEADSLNWGLQTISRTDSDLLPLVFPVCACSLRPQSSSSRSMLLVSEAALVQDPGTHGFQSQLALCKPCPATCPPDAIHAQEAFNSPQWGLDTNMGILLGRLIIILIRELSALTLSFLSSSLLIKTNSQSQSKTNLSFTRRVSSKGRVTFIYYYLHRAGQWQTWK